MTIADYVVLMLYIVGIFAIGGICSRKIKNSKDMFAAGSQSPWWVAGTSGFMTMFTAGTFVVWGGIGYKYGLVAISINMCYGVAGLLVGRFVAEHWRTLGIRTPAEYIQLRFGKGAIHFYAWTMMFYRMLGMGVALYSLSVLLVALMPLGEGNFLRDPVTGNLALKWAVLLFGAIIIFYTVAGGLWAVLMADVLQFIVLNLAVIFVVPLAIMQIGGIGKFAEAVPKSFFVPTTSEFTWFFLAGWCAIHFFMVGAEWAFVQRFLCVPTPKDARKAAYLFGVLYLISPFLWMLPPILYKAINPNANPEEAYILACRTVLPSGMMGMMLAAMLSSTSAAISGQLNVFAGVLMSDFYRALFKPKSTEEHLVYVGRVMTFILGLILILIAVSVPKMGGAEKVILSITSLIVGPLLAPSVWGLFSKRLSTNAVWTTGGICFTLGAIMKFGLMKGGFLTGIENLKALSEWLTANTRTMEIAVGVALPVAILTVMELISRGTNIGWERVATQRHEQLGLAVPKVSPLPLMVVAWCTGFFGAIMLGLSFVDMTKWRVFVFFAIALFAITAFCTLRYRKIMKAAAIAQEA